MHFSIITFGQTAAPLNDPKISKDKASVES